MLELVNTPEPDAAPQHRSPIERSKLRATMREAATWFRRKLSLVGAAPQALVGAAPQVTPFTPAKPMPGVLPNGSVDPRVAMDDASALGTMTAWATQFTNFGEGLGFLGYATLAELSQRPEFRRFADIISEEMTRKFFRLSSASDEDQSMRIKLLNDAFEKYKLKDVFRKLAEVDLLYGRASLYVDMGPTSDEVLRTPLVATPQTVPLHSLVGFKVIEPFWTYPAGYNTTDPTRDDFYKPRAWYVMGKEYHATRMLPFVGHEVPDILKPAYSFGGLSITQMVKPYVDNWIRTRQNVAETVETFAQQVLKTDLDATLTGGSAEDLDARLMLYNAIKNTRGVMVLNKDTEDFAVTATPLSGLDHLQAQAQEQMVSVVGVPLVKYTGITPSGLNASSDGEIRVFADTIAGRQLRFYGPHLKFILELIMLSELGEINCDISPVWETLWQMSEVEFANVRQTNANTAKTYIEAGVLDPTEERKRLANEEEGLYQGLNPDDLPEPPDDNAGMPQVDPVTGMPINTAENNLDPLQNDLQPKDSIDDSPDDVGRRAEDARVLRRQPVAHDRDTEFHEADHPRRTDGKFGSGGGGKGAATKPTPAQGSQGKAPAGQAGQGGGVGAAGGKNPPSATPAPARGNMQTTAVKDGVRVQADGSPLPEHVQNLKIPPAWTDVVYSNDPNAPLQAQGRDVKGRVQSRYSDAFMATNAAAKFERVEKLRKEFTAIEQQNATAMRSNNPKVRDAAECLELIMQMGVRPGSEDNTGADKLAYGATTLQGQHVVKRKDGTYLEFTGKKGVELKLKVPNEQLARKLQARAKAAGTTGQLFNIDEGNLLDHVHSLGSGIYKSKDFRTRLGTETAAQLISTIPAPKDAKSYKKAIKQIATEVSQRLGNTPTIALQSYINPTVFSAWGPPPL